MHEFLFQGLAQLGLCQALLSLDPQHYVRLKLLQDRDLHESGHPLLVVRLLRLRPELLVHSLQSLDLVAVVVPYLSVVLCEASCVMKLLGVALAPLPLPRAHALDQPGFPAAFP